MEKITISEQYKSLYQNLVKTAQQMELSVGGAYYRLSKMIEQRKQVDAELKSWWDKVAEEYKLDKNRDYYVDAEGVINMVERPAAPQPAAQPAPTEVLDDKNGGSVDDLK